MGAVKKANPKPCAGCPWRVANQGKRTAGGWYSRRNLDRLWAGLRRGEQMTCHPTDDRDPEYGAPEGATTHECAGALILVLRELRKFEALAEANPDGTPAAVQRAYRELSPRGCTREGFGEIVSRVLFAGVPRFGGLEVRALDLRAPVNHPALGEWPPPDLKIVGGARGMNA